MNRNFVDEKKKQNIEMQDILIMLKILKRRKIESRRAFKLQSRLMKQSLEMS